MLPSSPPRATLLLHVSLATPPLPSLFHLPGLLEDTLGSYFVPFLVAGIPPIFGSIAMFSMRCVKAPPQGAPGSPVKEPSEQQNNAAHHRQLQTLATGEQLPLQTLATGVPQATAYTCFI